MENWFTSPEIYYCEAPLYGAYFQPLNTISNLAFIIATALFYVRLKKANGVDTRFQIFAVLLITFGVGSAAWHAFPNFWTWLLDVVPVSVFFVYLAYYVHVRVFTRKRIAQLWFIAFLLWTGIVTLALQFLFERMLNGAESYIAQLTYLFGIAVYATYKNNSIAKWVFLLTGIFLIQLFFRQNDQAFCEVWPYGLHFLWHTTGGFSIYLGLYIIYFGWK